MNFTIDCQLLKKAISRVATILTVRNKDYYGINVGVADGKVHLFSSNGEEMMRESLELDATRLDPAGDGYLFLGMDKLEAILSKEDGELKFSNDGQRLRIESAASWYELPTAEPKLGFASWPHVDKGDPKSICVDSRLLGRAFRLAGVTDSMEVYKAYNLDCVTLHTAGGILEVLAADSRRMVKAVCPFKGDNWPESVSLHDSACAYAMSIFPEKDRESQPVHIAVQGASVVFESEQRCFVGRQLVRRVPPFEKFFDAQYDFELAMDSAELLLPFQRAEAVLDDLSKRFVSIRTDESHMIFSASSSSGRSETKIPCGTSMGRLRKFNPQYAAEFLRRLTGSGVRMGFSSKSVMMKLETDGAVCLVVEME